MSEDESEHPKRERWDGQIGELPYELVPFDGGERVELHYNNLDGEEEVFKGEVGGFMPHNSWLQIFGENRSSEYRVPDFYVRRDGIVLAEPYTDGDLFQVGRCQYVKELNTDSNQSGSGNDA
ncbi:hypothetical protein [Halorhabdus tiamatea]|nr:hypothetical protein [Halorhabdus tiamatea]